MLLCYDVVLPHLLERPLRHERRFLEPTDARHHEPGADRERDHGDDQQTSDS